MSMPQKIIQQAKDSANTYLNYSSLNSPIKIKPNPIITPSYCSPVIKKEFDEFIKMEEEKCPTKVAKSFETDAGKPIYSECSQIFKTSETQVKLEWDEYQIKIEDSRESYCEKHQDFIRSPKRSSLGPNSRHLSSTKNIAMNYGRAIFSFAKSSLALPYLTPHLKQEGISENEFYSFLKHNKINIQSIHGLRATLLVEDEDDAEMRACKKIFQWIAEVFIKCFSVNWIIHGKVSHKMVYLKYRFKMLRRIQNPEKFTYIKERHKNKKKHK